jgi:hypothetical protein
MYKLNYDKSSYGLWKKLLLRKEKTFLITFLY